MAIRFNFSLTDTYADRTSDINDTLRAIAKINPTNSDYLETGMLRFVDGKIEKYDGTEWEDHKFNTLYVDNISEGQGNDGVTIDGVRLKNGSIYQTGLQTNTTYNVDSSMNTQEIQNIINSIPKYIPDNITAIIKFADGIYNLTERLVFEGFNGNGELIIQAENSLSNASDGEQHVIINAGLIPNTSFKSSFYFFNNRIKSLIINGIYFKSDIAETYLVSIYSSIGLNVQYCKFDMPMTSFGYPLLEFQHGCTGQVYGNYFSGGGSGITFVLTTDVFVNRNYTSSIKPFYGIISNRSTIYLQYWRDIISESGKDIYYDYNGDAKYSWLSDIMVPVNNSMTVDQIQNTINSLPKYIPNGKTIYFLFDDRIYNFESSQLIFSGFLGGGELQIKALNSISCNDNFGDGDQNAQITGTSNVFLIENCNIKSVTIDSLFIESTHSSNGTSFVCRNVNYSIVTNCKIKAISSAYIGAIRFTNSSKALILGNYFDVTGYASISCDNRSIISLYKNYSSVNIPFNGILIDSSTVYRKDSGILIQGTSSMTLSIWGGRFFE